MELSRTLKRICPFFLAIIIAIVGVCLFQIQNDENRKSYAYYDELIKQYNEISTGFNQDGNTYSDVELYLCNELDKQNENNDVDNIKAAKKLFHDKLEYVHTYNDNLKEKVENANKILNYSLFSTMDSYNRLNTIKYANDMIKVENLNVDVSNTTAIERLLGFRELPIIFLLILIYLSMIFLEENYNGMSTVIRACAYGRTHMAIKRCAIFLLIIALSSFVINGIVFSIYLTLYGGYDGLFKLIQNSQVFSLFPCGVSCIQFFAIYCICFSLSMFAIGLLIYIIMLTIQSNKVSIAVIIGVFAIEGILYYKISTVSRFCVLKYINITTMLLPGDSYLKYINWGYDGFVTDVSNSTTIMMMVIMVVCVSLILITYQYGNKKRSVRWLIKLQELITTYFQKVLSRVNLLAQELYKAMVLQRCLGIIIIFCYILSMCKMYRGVDYSKKNIYLTEFYDIYEGRFPSEEMTAYVEEKTEKIDGLKMIKKPTSAQNFQLLELESAVNEINENIQYISNIKAEKGVDAVVINPVAYNCILGERAYSNSENINLLCCIAIIFVMSGLFSFEHKNNMVVIARTYKNRMMVWSNKAIMSLTFTFLIWGLSSLFYWNNITNLYTLNNLNVPLQSLSQYGTFDVEISIIQYMILVQVIRFLVLLFLSFIVFGISFFFSYIKSIIVSFIILIPHILYLFKIPNMDLLSIVNVMDFNRLWIEYGLTAMCCIIYLVIGLSGIALIFVTLKRWRGGRNSLCIKEQ